MSGSRTISSRTRPSILRWLTAGSAAYFGWLVTNLILAALMPLLAFIRLAGGQRGQVATRGLIVFILKIFFLRYFHFIGIYRIETLPDPEDVKSCRPCLFVANHRSWIDALLLTAIIPDVVIPVNAQYLKVPLIGTIMGWLGCIPLEKKSRKSLLEGAAKVRDALAQGRNVAVFPEGTRSPMGVLRHFSDFFFRIALDENVPIRPVVIHLQVPFLGPGRENFLTAHRAGLKISLLEPQRGSRGMRGADLARHVHKTMRRQLLSLDAAPIAENAKEC